MRERGKDTTTVYMCVCVCVSVCVCVCVYSFMVIVQDERAWEGHHFGLQILKKN